VIGGNANVRGAAMDHAQYRREHASNSGDLMTVLIACGRQRVIVPE
jgi:hypothetical protein